MLTLPEFAYVGDLYKGFRMTYNSVFWAASHAPVASAKYDTK